MAWHVLVSKQSYCNLRTEADWDQHGQELMMDVDAPIGQVELFQGL